MSIKTLSTRLPASWRLPVKAFALATVIAVTRLILDLAGAEGISMSPLVATLITADVFILSLLLTGVMSDYKESEKIPGDLSVSIGVIADECLVLWRHKQAEPARDCLQFLLDFTASFKRWFHRTERSVSMMEKISGMGDHFFALEPFTQPNFIVRLKQEQAAISRMFVRIHTIRETSFVSSAYTMARVATLLILAGLLSLRIEPWYESVFLVGVIGLFLSYLLLLIPDLDNPFDYSETGQPSGQEISLKPLDDLHKRISGVLADTAGVPAAGVAT
jgi:hypothetical protein